MKEKIKAILLLILPLLYLAFCWYGTNYKYYSLNVHPVSEDIFQFRIKGKSGLINVSNGEIIANAKYDTILCYSGGVCKAYSNNKWEYFVLNENRLIRPLEEGVTIVSVMSQYVVIAKDDQVGLMDMQGKMIVDYLPFKTYIYRIDYTNQIVYLCNDEKDKFGFVNLKENVLVEPVYEKRLVFSDNISIAKLNNKTGFINDKNEVIVDFLYDDAKNFDEGLAIVKYNSKYGYIDKMGNVVIDFLYDDAENFDEGLAVVKYNSKCGYIDKMGNVVIDFLYDGAENFDEGLAAVNYNSKYGYIDKMGNVVIDYQYDNAQNFNYGVAWIRIGDYRGFINKNNERIIPIHLTGLEIEFKIILTFDNVRYYVNNEGSIFYKNYDQFYGLTINGTKIINQKGKVIIDKKFKDIQYINDNMFCIKSGNLECYNMDGEKLFEHDSYSIHNYPKQDSLYIFEDNHIIYDIYYVYDKYGNLIYKSSWREKNLFISESNNFIVTTKGNKIISYNIKTKEKKVMDIYR